MKTLTLLIALLTACTMPAPSQTYEETNNTVVGTGNPHAHEHTGVTVNTQGDAYSESACLSNGIADLDIQLVGNPTDAASVVFAHYKGGNRAKITMPKSGDGYMVLQIFDWMANVRFFTDETVAYTVDGGDAFKRVVNPSCPKLGMTDQLISFQEWNSYVVHFSDTSPAEFWFHVAKQE
jgi:hypothetical protein